MIWCGRDAPVRKLLLSLIIPAASFTGWIRCTRWRMYISLRPNHLNARLRLRQAGRRCQSGYQQSSLDHYHARQIHQSDDRRRRPVPPSAMLRRLSNGTVRLRPCSTCAVTRTAFTTALPTPITTGPANGLREQSAEQGNHSRMRSYGNHENSWDTRHNRSGRQKSHCTQVHLLVLNERMERLTLDPHHEILG
jgi:hypothetical protein